MLYTESYQVRWHDTDATREMRPSEVLSYMQETANHQFRTHAVSLDTLRDTQGVGFILSRIAVDFCRPIHAYDQISVTTATCPGHGLCFPRRFEVSRNGECVARAMSQWAMVRVDDRRLLRVEEAALSFGDEPELETVAPLRLRIPRTLGFERVGERRVVYSDLDYNMHMNNTKYPNMLCDFLPDANAWRLRGLSLSYLHEAALGDTLAVERATDGAGNWYFRTYCGERVCLEGALYCEPREF